jgi:hypothetical protein
MATYPQLSPATLTNLAAVVNDPTDSEDANKLAQVDLQTRKFIYDYLIGKFDPSTELLNASALGDASMASKVKGSTANSGGTERAIVQGTVSTPDIRDGAITAAKIADGVLTTALIADGSITADKLGASSVITSKIGAGQVTTEKLANDAVDAAKLKDDATGAAGAVTSDHIRHEAVTTEKIADAAVTPEKLAPAAGPAYILVSDGDNEFQPVLISGDASMTSAGVLTVGSSGLAIVEERAANGIAGGDSVAGGAAFTLFNVRGVAVTWVNMFQSIAFVTLPGAGKIQLTAGTYIIEASVPGHEVGLHICRLSRYNASDIFQEAVYGTSETAPAAAGVQTRSFLRAKVVCAATDYLKLEHWTAAVKATTGLGVAVSSGGDYEKHAQVRIQKIA